VVATAGVKATMLDPRRDAMTDKPRTIIFEDGQVLLDTADPDTYVTLGDEGLPTTFLDLDVQEALGIAPEPMTARQRAYDVLEELD